ncbi:hypothetical protein L1049_004507 [Liquidambar formosana]|uniref:Uncharacterized protein n=1 Tax=Liquidambar formosana TaxID=63359 RepID=A0AAP0WVR4_LIQFO
MKFRISVLNSEKHRRIKNILSTIHNPHTVQVRVLNPTHPLAEDERHVEDEGRGRDACCLSQSRRRQCGGEDEDDDEGVKSSVAEVPPSIS